MKKLLLMVSALIFLLAISALATDMRVLTMGDNNTILLDEANIWIFPSRINYYPDLAGIELAHIEEPIAPLSSVEISDPETPMERVGVNFKFGDEKPWVLGLYLHNNVPFTNEYAPSEPNGVDMVMPAVIQRTQGNKRADLFYGRKLFGNDLGFHFGMVQSSTEGATSINYDETGFSQYNFDLGVTMMDGLLDFAAGVETFTITNKVTQATLEGSDTVYFGRDELKDDGNSAYYIRARYFHEMNPTCTFVPHFGYTTGKFGWSNWDWRSNPTIPGDSLNVMDYSDETKTTEFEFGIGLHYTPASKLLAALDIGLKSTKIEQTTTNPDDSSPTGVVITKSKTTTTTLPYFKLGFEAGVFRWMDIRFGAQSFWTKNTTENVTSSSLTKSIARFPDNRTFLGLGFHWGKFHVDTYMNPELFINGFNFISGETTTNMNLAISAVYEMH